MDGYRRILCPVDTSACSKRAFGEALSLAERFDGSVVVLHVYHVPANVQPSVLVWAAVGPRPLWELAEEQARTELETFLEEWSLEARRRTQTVIEAGDPASAIVERARRGSHDLVVMGTHGRTGAERLVIGSVAERVVRLAPCPVLVVPLAHVSA